MFILDWEVFRQDVVSATDDKLVDEQSKICETLIAFFAVFLGPVRIAAAKNR
jgi:hypothetical protein